eukprot:scaffold2741_cov134-Isochrysis_galbana.AAC.9
MQQTAGGWRQTGCARVHSPGAGHSAGRPNIRYTWGASALIVREPTRGAFPPPMAGVDSRLVGEVGPAFPWPPRSGIPSLRTRNAPSGAVVPPAPLASFLSAGLLGIRPQSRPLPK